MRQRASRNARTHLALALASLLAAGVTQADTFTYSGRLDEHGAPADGRYDLKLSVHANTGQGYALVKPLEFKGVDVIEGDFRVEFDLPPGYDDAEVELAIRPAGGAGWVALPGRTKAFNTPAAVGQCWSTTGDSGSNPEINFLGTTDAQPLVLRTQNVRSLRIEPSTVLFGGSPITTNVIAGSQINTTLAGVRGATISGGGANPTGDPDFDTEAGNFVSDHYGAIGGGYSNVAGDQMGSNADAAYATVGGGRNSTAASLGSTVSGGAENLALGAHSAVGGGLQNRTTQAEATIAGGSRNSANGVASAVAGGGANDARGLRSFVAAGSFNCAGADFSLAAGRQAKVRPGADPNQSNPNTACSGLPNYPGGGGDSGTFVWADGQDMPFVSSGINQFLIRADGGLFLNTNARTLSGDDVVIRARQNSGDSDVDFRLQTRAGKNLLMFVSEATGGLVMNVSELTSGSSRLIVNGGSGGGASLSNGGTWTNASSRTFKEGFAAVDPLDVLDRLLDLPISTWTYTGSAEGLHLGPVAEDFKQAFGLAGDGTSIATVDADGVALAAIQGLNAKLEAQNARLSSQNEALLARLEALEAALSEREPE
jgi:hypothetical protein